MVKSGLEFFILKFTEPFQSCWCPVRKKLPRKAELAWKVSRYLWIILREKFTPIVQWKTIFPNFHWKKRRITAATENFSNETNLLSNSTEFYENESRIWNLAHQWFHQINTYHWLNTKAACGNFVQKVFETNINFRYQRVKTQKK